MWNSKAYPLCTDVEQKGLPSLYRCGTVRLTLSVQMWNRKAYPLCTDVEQKGLPSLYRWGTERLTLSVQMRNSRVGVLLCYLWAVQKSSQDEPGQTKHVTVRLYWQHLTVDGLSCIKVTHIKTFIFQQNAGSIILLKLRNTFYFKTQQCFQRK